MSIENEGFVLVAKFSELSDNSKRCVEIDDHFVVLVRIGNDIFCLDDVCTHDGGTLGDGELIDHCLVCPRHGAHFDVRTGDAVTMPATEPTIAHEVRVTGDDVFVRLKA